MYCNTIVLVNQCLKEGLRAREAADGVRAILGEEVEVNSQKRSVALSAKKLACHLKPSTEVMISDDDGDDDDDDDDDYGDIHDDDDDDDGGGGGDGCGMMMMMMIIMMMMMMMMMMVTIMMMVMMIMMIQNPFSDKRYPALIILNHCVSFIHARSISCEIRDKTMVIKNIMPVLKDKTTVYFSHSDTYCQRFLTPTILIIISI
ncbi:hypothetical protein ElyMa_002788400 [Elysia marginata]|uniref:Uncharacterized protein n=1 Tax=Elysia marginata TaxID=1093978 RepID=A0AAV4HPX8_9GAST|nr:hypothetical protein ElyMa_002788400 [Elysia marginata]